jgi:hypothetical protein
MSPHDCRADTLDAIPGDETETPDLSVLNLHRRRPPRCPLEVFGAAWSQWISNTAAASACAPDYVAAPLLAAASALIGHARWAQATPGWSEPPHLWCVSVGESGQGKSPGADPIYRHVLPPLEEAMARDFPERLQEYHSRREVAKSRREAWQREVRAAHKKGSPPPAPPVIACGPEPLAPRLMQNDLTIEKVALLLANAAPKGLLMVRDELAGWFLGMNAYNHGARAFWIEAFGGRPYRVDRMKHPHPISVPHLAVAWHGGIQPSRLAQVMREADDGLLARFCWFWPDSVPFKLATALPCTAFAINAFDRLRMLEMRPATEPGFSPTPVHVPLDGKARAHLERFAREMQERQEAAGGLLVSALGKARGLALRLSLVLEFLRWSSEDGISPPPTELSEEAFLAAAKFVREYLIPMAERVYGDAAATPRTRNTATLARWIARTRPPEVHVRHLQRDMRLPGLGEADQIHAACATLVEAGWLVAPAVREGAGRPRAAYPVRRQLWEALR